MTTRTKFLSKNSVKKAKAAQGITGRFGSSTKAHKIEEKIRLEKALMGHGTNITEPKIKRSNKARNGLKTRFRVKD